MTLIDRARIELAIVRYDFWLDLRGVRGRRRRELRRELRANLTDAARDVGTTRALFGIGSPKELAHAAQPQDPSRPRWQQGVIAASAVFTLVAWGLLATALVVLQTVEASGVGSSVEVHPFPWFGTTFTAQHSTETINAGILTPWPLFLLPLLAFVLVAQPWRLLRRANAVTVAGGTSSADH